MVLNRAGFGGGGGHSRVSSSSSCANGAIGIRTSSLQVWVLGLGGTTFGPITLVFAVTIGVALGLLMTMLGGRLGVTLHTGGLLLPTPKWEHYI